MEDFIGEHPIIAFLLFFGTVLAAIFACGIIFQTYQNSLPCEEFKNTSYQYMPARCLDTYKK